MTAFELVPRPERDEHAGDGGARGCENEKAFCSITTAVRADGNQPRLHKQTPTYAQRSAVLSVPLTGGETYVVQTRCITQRQESIQGGKVKAYVYATQHCDVKTDVAGADGKPTMDWASAESMVSADTCAKLSYGEEGVPDDMHRQKDEGEKEKEEDKFDPEVMQKVLGELEQQRDNLYAYSKAEFNPEPPAILERPRRTTPRRRASPSSSACVGESWRPPPSVDQQDEDAAVEADAAAIEITTLKSRPAAAGGGAAASGQFAEVEAQQRELLQRVQQAEAQRDAAYARAQQAGARRRRGGGQSEPSPSASAGSRPSAASARASRRRTRRCRR